MSDMVLYSANSTLLDILGMCDVMLIYKQRSTTAAVYVGRHVSTLLLGRDVIAKLSLFAKVEEVSDKVSTSKHNFLNCFVLLGACRVNTQFASRLSHSHLLPLYHVFYYGRARFPLF